MTLAPQYMMRWPQPPTLDATLTTTRQIGKGVWEAKRRMNTLHPSWLVAYGRTQRKALKALEALGATS